jgi:hypothetical protein
VAGSITVRELVTVLGFKVDEQTLNNYDKLVKKIAVDMQQFGRQATTFVTLPLALAAGFAVKAASDAAETQSKFSVVFDEVSKDAKRVAEDLRDNYGLSRRASQELLANTGDLLAGFGFTDEAALDLSSQVNKLAVDLASFTNLEGGAERASKALTKALLGERESAKELNIAILEADVTAEVAKMRAAGQRFATERQAKAYATLNIALRQSKNAIGDFGRTQFQLANRFRTFTQRISDVAVGFGNILLPVVTDLVNVGVKLLEWIDNLTPNTKRLIIIFGAVAAAIGPIILVVSSLTIAFLTLGSAVLWVPLLILAVVAVLTLFIDDFLNWRDGQNSILGILLGDYETFVQSAKDIWNGLFDFLAALWLGHWADVQNGVRHFLDTLTIMFSDWGEELVATPGLKLIGKFVSGIGSFIGGTRMLVEEAATSAGGFVGGLGVQRPDTFRLSPAQQAQLAATGSVNVNQRIEVNVPAGTTPDQADMIARVAQAAVRSENEASARQLINSNPQVD